MTAPTVALSLKTGTMTETSEATDTDSVVRKAPASIRAFYAVHRGHDVRTSSAAGPRPVQAGSTDSSCLTRAATLRSGECLNVVRRSGR
jgi:hypothetical protein